MLERTFQTRQATVADRTLTIASAVSLPRRGKTKRGAVFEFAAVVAAAGGALKFLPRGVASGEMNSDLRFKRRRASNARI